MQLARRKTKKKPRHDGKVRSERHKNFVRRHNCIVDDCAEIEGIHAHHVRKYTEAGMGLKPGDEWVVPLCQDHHGALHTNGQATFESMHGLDLREAALWFARRSPDDAIKEAVSDE